MSDQLLVYLDGVRIGTLSQSRQGSLGFTYDSDYLALPDPTPLSLSMPPHAGSHRNRVARAFLEGLLPDNQAVRERWGATFGVSANNPFALLRHVGRDAAGAVQVLPPETPSTDAAHHEGDIDWLSDDEFVALVRDLAEHRADWNPGRYAGQWSLAGAQSKVALYRSAEEDAWGIPRDSTPTTHIIKPALEGLDDHHLNEVLCQRAASHLGLPAARSELVELSGVRAIVSTRYDRARDQDGRLHRLHQEDLCQALAVTPSQKYQADGGPGVGEIADLFTHLGAADRRASTQRFLDALIYNVLIGGTDAHAKNYSLLISAGPRIRLAPLYDLASILPYDEFDLRRVKLAMKIGGEYALDHISIRQWHKLARELRLDVDAVIVSLRQMAAEILAQIGEIKAHAAKDGLAGEAVDRLAERLTNRMTACLNDLNRSSTSG